MKKRIHLTESQLHRLIEGTLNELDWKTYMNAANKRTRQCLDTFGDSDIDCDTTRKYFKSADDLSDWAAQTFDKKYGTKDSAFYPQGDYGTGFFKVNTPVIRSSRKEDNFGPEIDYETRMPLMDIDDYAKGYQTYQDGHWRSNNPDPYSWTNQRGMGESLARRVTESVIRKLKRGINEADSPRSNDGIGSDKQQLVNFIIQTMKNTFLTSVWDIDVYTDSVDLIEEGDTEPRSVVYHIQILNSSKLAMYDYHAGIDFYPEDVDIRTLQQLADYMNRQKQKAQSMGIVPDIEVSESVEGMMLPYRYIGNTRIMPTACKYYAQGGYRSQFVNTDDFYYNDYDEYRDYDEEYPNESLIRRIK